MAEERTLQGSFSITLNLTDKRQIMMSGYVYKDDTQEQINTRVDLFQEILDRQLIRADLASKEAQITSLEGGMEQLRAHYDALVRVSQTGRKLTSQQKLQVEQFDVSVAANTKQRDSLRAAIDEGRKKLNGARV